MRIKEVCFHSFSIIFEAIGEVYPSWSLRFQDIQGPLTWCQWIQFPRGWSRQCTRTHRNADRSGQTDMKIHYNNRFLGQRRKNMTIYTVYILYQNPAKEPKKHMCFLNHSFLPTKKKKSLGHLVPSRSKRRSPLRRPSPGRRNEPRRNRSRNRNRSRHRSEAQRETA